MKKFSVYGLVLLFCVALALNGCGGSSNNPSASSGATPSPSSYSMDLSTAGSQYTSGLTATSTSITATGIESFYVPLTSSVASDKTIYVTVSGTYTGSLGFRSWLTNDSEGTSSETTNGFYVGTQISSGTAFTLNYSLTATATATRLFFKATTSGGQLETLVITAITISTTDTATATPTPSGTGSFTSTDNWAASCSDVTLSSLALSDSCLSTSFSSGSWADKGAVYIYNETYTDLSSYSTITAKIKFTSDTVSSLYGNVFIISGSSWGNWCATGASLTAGTETEITLTITDGTSTGGTTDIDVVKRIGVQFYNSTGSAVSDATFYLNSFTLN